MTRSAAATYTGLKFFVGGQTLSFVVPGRSLSPFWIAA